MRGALQKVSLGPAVEVVPGGQSMAHHQVAGWHLVIFDLGDGSFSAMHDLCTHADARFSQGWLEEDCVACPWHGAQFDIRTGKALSLPATEDVRMFDTQVVDGHLQVILPPAPPAT